MNRDARVGRDLAYLSFKHGIAISMFRGPKACLPDEPLSPEERQAVMEENISLVGGNTRDSRAAVVELRRANRDYEVRESLLTSMRSDALEVERGEALVALLRRGLDAHPMFTRIAGAESVDEIRDALSEAERPTGVRRPLGTLQAGARKAARNFSGWARIVAGGFS